ncbi:YceI family protein [Paludibaculum fermentans]|uniref:YceI family protein n=1 Tax=Paludibaculum fermentans TaxID=1473598 RepID=A0A7S7NU57_PALFE|nr:YceI family protein [Paludibaculum fermentans]QOY89868.1 YceI family protein [Paludibaculum fermentans]
MANEAVQEVAVAPWSIDPAHSSIQFKIRHMAIAWVRGSFRVRTGTLHLVKDNIAESRIEVDIDPASVNSGEVDRDTHLRNADFFDVARYPSIHFQSTGISGSPGSPVVAGDLTIRSVTRPVEVKVGEISAPTPDPWGSVRIAVTASVTINRKDFGLTWNKALETGGFLVGDDIFVDLDIEFVSNAK